MAALGHAEQRVLDDLAAWRPAFLDGRLKARGIRQPKLEPGERFACKIPMIFASGSGEPRIRGAAHATDRRVFVVQNRPFPVREWRWEQIETVVLIKWTGVLIGAEPADVIASQRPATRSGAVGWLQLAGAHAAARGSFDDWFNRLADLLTSTAGTPVDE